MINKDWTGNKKSTFATLGASNHAEGEREQNDYYATEPRTIDELFKIEDFSNEVWEPACGEGHLSKRMAELGKEVKSTDLIARGFGEVGVDFLQQNEPWSGDIITNPPYKYAKEFVEKSLELICDEQKVAMFLKITFLEGQNRLPFFLKNPPTRIYVYSSRRQCAVNGEFRGSSAACYAWFIWIKGRTSKPTIDWIK